MTLHKFSPFRLSLGKALTVLQSKDLHMLADGLSGGRRGAVELVQRPVLGLALDGAVASLANAATDARS